MAPHRRLALALLAAMALAAAASPALAQPPVCDLVTAVNPARQEHRPGEALRYNFTVGNEANLAGDVVLALEGVTSGWSATVAPERFDNLPAGQQASAEVLVTAPASGAGQAQVTVRATLTCETPLGCVPEGVCTDTDTQVLTPSLATAGGGAGILPVGGGGLLLLAGGLVLVAVAGAAVLALRPRGLVVRAPEPRREVPPGGGASFPVLVENRGRDALEAAVQVAGLPAGWKVVSPPPSVALAPGAGTTLQVLVRSPADARPGDAAEAEVRFEERGTGRVRSVRLEARVAGEERPDVVVRDEAGLRRERKRKR